MKKCIIIVLICTMFVSCARRSGHKKQNRQMASEKREIVSRLSNDDVSVHEDLSVEYGDDDEVLDGKTIFRKYGNAVFMVFTTDGTNTYQGSGFFINSHGLAVSNYHVFKGTAIGAEQIKLVGSDTAFKVTRVVRSDEKEDFIIFFVNVDDTPFIPIAKQKPSVGDKVYAIGSPRGLENTFSSGEVSQWRDTNLMQINALIDHGSSGGALINEYGEVVGVTSGTFYDGSQANLNYAWSIDVIKPYLK